MDEECKHGIYPASSCTMCNGKDKARQEIPEIRVFEARYKGVCWDCDESIEINDRIKFQQGKPVVHEECDLA